MIDFEEIGKIIGIILAIGGVIALLIGAISLTSSSPNIGAFVGGAVALGIGLFILKELK